MEGYKKSTLFSLTSRQRNSVTARNKSRYLATKKIIERKKHFNAFESLCNNDFFVISKTDKESGIAIFNRHEINGGYS